MSYLLFEKHPHYEIHTIFKFVIIQMDRKKGIMYQYQNRSTQ